MKILGTYYTTFFFNGSYYTVFKNYELIIYTYYTKNKNDELITQDLITLELIIYPRQELLYIYQLKHPLSKG